MPQNDFTRAEILAAHHAELRDTANSIPAVELDDAAHAGLLEAIERDLVISIYTHGLSEEWVLELNHFGAHPVMQPWQEFRKSLEWWSEHWSIVLDWPHVQSDGSEDAE
jgi:hypothetical protein